VAGAGFLASVFCIPFALFPQLLRFALRSHEVFVSLPADLASCCPPLNNPALPATICVLPRLQVLPGPRRPATALPSSTSVAALSGAGLRLTPDIRTAVAGRDGRVLKTEART
jgi:hypothetical protein